ncbi:MAG: hypothetical protein JWM64_883 [Frankiales bacterium]|nr:hypothetical protein [Frankiales bacterium]
MRGLLPVVVLALLLVPGCDGASDDRPAPERAQDAATSACREVAPLLARPTLRRSDLSALTRARTAAAQAERLDPRWTALHDATTGAREAALAVEASSRTATSNTEQSRTNAAYRAAVTALQRACAEQ